jgi:hypothetical protein
MTRKDYVLLAESLAYSISLAKQLNNSTTAIHIVIGVLCADLHRENPRFDKDKFKAEIDRMVAVQDSRKVVA